MNNEIIYYSDKKETVKSLILAIVATIILAYLNIGRSFDTSGIGIYNGEYILLGIWTLIVFLVIICTKSTLISRKIIINDKDIKIIGVLGFFSKYIDWKDIYIVMLGEVENKKSIARGFFYGIEFRNKNAFGRIESNSFKVSHIGNHEKLIEEIINICRNQGIAFQDFREIE